MSNRDAVCQFLDRGMQALGLAPLPESSLAGLGQYFVELQKWNRTINLVARAADEEVLESHFLDSLTLLPEIANGPLLDVGSGAGFPGLVLKIARPELAVTLVEPRQKRVSFLRHVIRTIGLTGVTVVEERLVANDPGFSAAHGQFPVVTSRALAEIAPFLDLVADMVAPHGQVLCMKGPRAEEELHLWRQQAVASPFVLDRCVTFALPFSGAKRSLVSFRKRLLAAEDTP